MNNYLSGAQTEKGVYTMSKDKKKIVIYRHVHPEGIRVNGCIGQIQHEANKQSVYFLHVLQTWPAWLRDVSR